MPAGSTAFLTFPTDLTGWIVFIAGIAAIISGLVSLGVAFFTKFLPWWRARRSRVSLEKGLSADIYSPEIIQNAIRYYIEPFCQSLDPAGGDEPRLVYGAKENLFKAIDRGLTHPTEYRYIFVLADSGMGKSSFMINYYARNLLNRKRKFEIALFPLGLPDVDTRITKVKNQKDTVLFLDAFDEDTLAIVDHGQRLKDLLELTRDFKRIVITCRTQFFPKDEEIPREVAGIIKIGPRAAGEKAKYQFHKFYLAPFTDEQVTAYLKRRYPFWQRKQRQKAQKMVEAIPNLSVRPMLLAHVNDLIEKDKIVTSSYELYEEMVDAWLEREEGILENLEKEPLRKFSEQLAVNLYVNRKQRGAEWIHRDKEELVELARQWNIPLNDWQLTGRSLLNRDADGNFKFAHRSIMEFLFVKQFIEGNKACKNIPWSDQIQTFLWERVNEYLNRKEKPPFALSGADFSLIDFSSINLEKKYRPQSLKTLSPKDVAAMIKKYDFFCRKYDWSKNWANPNGKGIEHHYVEKEIGNDKVVIDIATGLMWQQSGSDKSLTFKIAESYVVNLNKSKFAGFDDWRLPTLEEAMSLMEPQTKNKDLYIDLVFSKTQRWIWTGDLVSASAAWIVDFGFGYCNADGLGGYYYVRAVR